MTQEENEMAAPMLGSAEQPRGEPLLSPEGGQGRRLFLVWTNRNGWAWYEPDERGVIDVSGPGYTHHSDSGH